MNASSIRITVAMCTLCIALPAMAGDVRAQLTPDLIYSHCQTAGVGSQTEGTFMLPGGRVTGTVLCTEADLAAANMMAPTQYGEEEDDDDDNYRRPDGDDDRD
ncbi:MAG: hypothetical protein KJ944_09945 [Alphaproteobacteria bacterium]|uniref:Uncharacterized protein n=1 Tax=Pannonibacter phragmitetus TaxID=121719 RepID=A0A0U3N612_9HYPH|nr:hypothetical protein [Pannonibacter phragmitetus]MBU1335802.1 hypothetical protein [Alphaproteobacteria bacterium]ALV26667.1 hypothetical protein APZ00_05880 [Pannonibacter phragmitetus]MBU1561247.1 hypothetical protein [Alphaproteobacteria bacterium]MBU2302909.1 hypothetical protein [Alphaproteobacteria bacterium]MBU2370343.1 hypothetical protein [Alphaproteobacteria bacterium]